MAVIEDIASLAWQHAKLILIVGLLTFFLRNYLWGGLYKIPGPFWAKITNIWRFVDVSGGQAHLTHLRLHKKHGQYVRLGPNVVSVNNLAALKEIYGINKGYTKTDFYRVQQALASGKATQTLFTSLDEDFHARIRRPISSFYSMSGLTEFEPFVDTTIHTLLKRFDEFAQQGETVNAATWLQYYAFDVIGEMTFGRQLGFLEEGCDKDKIMLSIEKFLDYAATIGQMPYLDKLLIKNPCWSLLRRGATGPVPKFARARLTERLEGKGSTQTSHRDFLSRFLEAKTSYPTVVTEAQIFSYTLTNVMAGSDTTAISLRAVLYYTLKHPKVRVKLVQELDDARAAGKLSIPVSWKESQELSYLDAVIKEALRLHPAVGLLLERIVPEKGLQLPDGPFLPPGTIVGGNPWVIHHHPVFGEDVDRFVPERWLQRDDETDVDFSSRRQAMNGATYTFGAGTRNCIGRNISLLEIYKLIPSLFSLYDIELVSPGEWKIRNSWFVRQWNIDIRLSKR